MPRSNPLVRGVPALLLTFFSLLLAGQLGARTFAPNQAGWPFSTCPSHKEVRVFLWEWGWDYYGPTSIKYVVWKDTRLGPAGDLFAQKFHIAWGVWMREGVAVTTASEPIERWGAALDGTGGMVVVYISGQPPEQDVVAQRLGWTGRRQWDTPVRLAGGPGPQRVSHTWKFVAPDGEGGAIVAWEDCSHDPDCDIRAGRVAMDGSLPWGPGGVPVAAAGGRQDSPLVLEDGSGGAFVIWTDEGAGAIRGQRLNAEGNPLWTPGGVHLAAGESATDIVTDGAGGAVIAITATCREKDVFVQRITPDGGLPWGGPVEVTCEDGWQWNARIAPDETGGAFVTWNEDPAHPGPSPTSPDVYVQRVDGTGALRWPPGGVAVTEEPGEQRLPQIRSSARTGGKFATLTWVDFRSPGGVYVRGVDEDGNLRHPAPELVSTDMADTDDGGLTLLQGGGDFKVFRTNRCGPEQLWTQLLPYCEQWDPPFPCPDPLPVCPDGEMDCGACISAVAAAHGIPEGTTNSLVSKAEAACKALDRGHLHTGGNILCALRHAIDAQEGKHIPEEAARELRRCVWDLAAGAPLPCVGW